MLKEEQNAIPIGCAGFAASVFRTICSTPCLGQTYSVVIKFLGMAVPSESLSNPDLSVA